jgi:transposase
VGETMTVDDGMEIVFSRVAGLDIGKRELAACVRVPDKNGRFRSQTKTFSTVTRGLLELAAWLAAHRVQVVAMEATGAYWKPVFYLLESSFETQLVNPRDVKQVKGRKTDVKDAQWLAQLVQHDLVRSCFVPPPRIRDLRELTRQHTHLTRDRARTINRLEKLIEETGLKISSVASNTLGASTRAMLEAIVAGERDPAVLAEMAKGRLRAKIPQLREALQIARFSDASAFMIGQVLAQIDTLDAQRAAYVVKIEEAMRPFHTGQGTAGDHPRDF